MSELWFCRVMFIFMGVNLGYSVVRDPLWTVIFFGAMVGFWNWRIRYVQKNLQG